MSILTTNLRALAVLGSLSALPLVADGPSLNVGGAVIKQLDSARTITNYTNGFSVSGAADWAVSAGYTVRAGLALNVLPGRTMVAPGRSDNGVKTTLDGLQLFSDIHIPTGTQGLNLVVGLSVQQWQYKTSKPAASVSPIGADSASGTIKGPKLGGRIGLDWRFNAKWSAEFMIQQTELGNKDSSEVRGDASVSPFLTNENPGWYQLGLRYHF